MGTGCQRAQSPSSVPQVSKPEASQCLFLPGDRWPWVWGARTRLPPVQQCRWLRRAGTCWAGQHHALGHHGSPTCGQGDRAGLRSVARSRSVSSSTSRFWWAEPVETEAGFLLLGLQPQRGVPGPAGSELPPPREEPPSSRGSVSTCRGGHGPRPWVRAGGQAPRCLPFWVSGAARLSPRATSSRKPFLVAWAPPLTGPGPRLPAELILPGSPLLPVPLLRAGRELSGGTGGREGPVTWGAARRKAEGAAKEERGSERASGGLGGVGDL